MILKPSNAGNASINFFLLAYLIRFSEVGGEIAFILFWAVSFLLATYFFINQGGDRQTYSRLMIFFLLALIFFVSSIYAEGLRITQGLMVLANMLIGLMLSKLIFNKLYAIVMCYGLILFYLYHAALGINPNDVFRVSQNNISITLIFALSYYILAKEAKGEELSFSLTLVVFFISVWAIGRSGIASTFILLCGVFLTKKLSLKIIILGMVIFLLFFLNYFSIGLDELSYGLFRLSERLNIIDIRYYSNKEYFELATSSVGKFFFGADISYSPTIMELDGNPHNSYIKLHYLFGFLGFVLIAILCFQAVLSSFSKRKFFSILIIAVILFRSSTDIALVGGPLDLLLFIVIFRELSSSMGRGKNQSTIRSMKSSAV